MVQTAVRRLAIEKAPETVSQLVMWRMATGKEWAELANISRRYVKPEEVALAKRISDQLAGSLDDLGPIGKGSLYVSFVSDDPSQTARIEEWKGELSKAPVLGLQARFDATRTPEGPAVGCQVRLENGGEKAQVVVYTTESTGRAWRSLAKFEQDIPAGKPSDFIDVLAAEMGNRLVRMTLVKGSVEKGKLTHKLSIENLSPLILNGLTIGGANPQPGASLSMLAGFSLPPRKGFGFPVSDDVIDRLGLKEGVRVEAMDLNEF